MRFSEQFFYAKMLKRKGAEFFSICLFVSLFATLLKSLNRKENKA